MRPHILLTLVGKEFHRHLANRAGVALGLLIVAGAVVLAGLDPGEAGDGNGAVGGVRHCFVEYDRVTPLVRHLGGSVPPELAGRVVFRPLAAADAVDGVLVYEPGAGAIQVRQPAGGPVRVAVWHPAGDPAALAGFEGWFWRESRRAFAAEAGAAVPDPPAGDVWPVVEAHRRLQDQAPGVPDLHVVRHGLGGRVLDVRAAVATGLVMFALYLACVYLFPTFTCEERERGVLLAQALTPATPGELLLAKYLFYPAAGVGLAAAAAGAYRPAVLLSPFFWLALLAVGGGFLGIGTVIAGLARTQRGAFLGGMGYLLTVSLVLLVCMAGGVPVVPQLAVEYHGPRVVHAAVTGSVTDAHWGNLLAAVGLAGGWLAAGGWLFARASRR